MVMMRSSLTMDSHLLVVTGLTTHGSKTNMLSNLVPKFTRLNTITRNTTNITTTRDQQEMEPSNLEDQVNMTLLPTLTGLMIKNSRVKWEMVKMRLSQTMDSHSQVVTGPEKKTN